MKVYITEYDIKNANIKDQIILGAQIKYALATEHTHLMDKNHTLFQIATENNQCTLLPVDKTSESDVTTEDIFGVHHKEEDMTPLTSVELIDVIIQNTLMAADTLTLEQAETLLVLAKIRRIIQN